MIQQSQFLNLMSDLGLNHLLPPPPPPHMPQWTINDIQILYMQSFEGYIRTNISLVKRTMFLVQWSASSLGHLPLLVSYLEMFLHERNQNFIPVKSELTVVLAGGWVLMFYLYLNAMSLTEQYCFPPAHLLCSGDPEMKWIQSCALKLEAQGIKYKVLYTALCCADCVTAVSARWYLKAFLPYCGV